jgi:hypothetical protein
MITNTYVITYYCYVSGYLIYSFVIIQELKEVSIYSISVTSTCTCISWQSIFRSFYFGSQYFLEVEEIKDPQGFVGVWHQIQIYLNLYFWVKFIKGIPSENHQPAKSPWQPHQNKVVLNTSIMCWNQNVNSCGVMHWLYVCRYLPMDNVNSYGVMHWLYVCRYLPMDNVNSSTHGLLFLSILFQHIYYKAAIIITSSKSVTCNFFLIWYSWNITHLALNNNYSIIRLHLFVYHLSGTKQMNGSNKHWLHR